jgi:2-polyprenyl-3-methyl-5-hydroxy-6-metoxy-1,4-benzoquinol methylase
MMPTRATAATRYSCVVDDHPKFRLQAAYLVWSLIELGGVDPVQVVVHYVGDPPHAFRALMTGRHRVELRRVSAAQHAYCNKVQQLDTFAGAHERVVLLDCDTIVTRPTPWPADVPVAAKRVDTATPPESVLRALFEQANLTPSWGPSDCLPGREGGQTVTHNYNGGVYAIDGAAIGVTAAAWRRWIDFCLARRELLAQDWVHVDQVAFALAMTELGIETAPLDRRFNFPTHLTLPPALDCDPYVLHYHWMLDDQQLLRKTGLAGVDRRIAQINARLEAERQSAFDNATFWDYRYATNLERGSGLGSRGPSLAAKRDLVQRLLDAGAYPTVLDVGCGDLETTRHVTGAFEYTGVDVSLEALNVARTKRPDWRFLPAHALATGSDETDFALAMSFDVLIHQSTRADYDALIALLVESAADTLVVAGYDDAPAFTSSLTYYYEPLRESLGRTGAFAEMFTVARYRDVSVIVAKRSRQQVHARDMTADKVHSLVGWTRDPLRFRELLDFSRRRLGFFPDHSPRAVEYAWVADRIEALPGPPKSVIDAGAGVTCLPLYLAERGHGVVTVDNHPLRRRIEDRAEWNEWGFLDYAQLDPRIRSLNVPFETLDSGERHDVVYSVSVIEHLATPVRQAWLRRIAGLLRPGGALFLTVDLIAPGDELWPFAEGRIVEESHGSLGDLCDEMRSVGLGIQSLEVVRALPATRVDIALIAAGKPAAFDAAADVTSVEAVDLARRHPEDAV